MPRGVHAFEDKFNQFNSKPAIMKKLIIIFFVCLPLFAAKVQTVSSAQWIAKYKGKGTLKVFEGKLIRRDEKYNSGVFSHYEYDFWNCTSDFWGVYQPCAVFLVENSDEKSKLIIKPKKNINNLTQPIQIVGSNSNFKLIKVLVKKDTEHNVYGIESSSVFIDGDVGKFISKTKMFITAFYFRNIGLFSCPAMNESYLHVGQPNSVISNAYVDIEGYTNHLDSFTQGNIDIIKIKYGIENSVIVAGADYLDNVFTKDYPAVYAANPPSGSIGTIKANIISGIGRKKGDWLPTSRIISAKRPKLKLKPEQILTEGTSVYITQ